MGKTAQEKAIPGKVPEAVPSSDVEVMAPGTAAPNANLAHYLQTVAAKVAEGAEDAQDAIIDRILSAGSVDDVLKTTQVIHAGDILYRPLEIRGVKWNESDFEDAEGVYALLDVFDYSTGKTEVVSCGGRNVMAQLFRLEQLGAFPAVLQFTQSQRPTKNGYLPLWLEPASKPVGQGEEAF